MTKRELEAALDEACKLRDQWCAEYAKMRNRYDRLLKAKKARDNGSR